jgi:hypothetical protein
MLQWKWAFEAGNEQYNPEIARLQSALSEETAWAFLNLCRIVMIVRPCSKCTRISRTPPKCPSEVKMRNNRGVTGEQCNWDGEVIEFSSIHCWALSSRSSRKRSRTRNDQKCRYESGHFGQRWHPIMCSALLKYISLRNLLVSIELISFPWWYK